MNFCMDPNSISTKKVMDISEDFKIKKHDCRDLYFSKVDEESKNIPEETIPEAMMKIVSQNPDFIVMKSKSNANGDFDISISMRAYLDLTKAAAKSFIKLGLDSKCAVGIIGFNHIAYCVSQFGCIFAGGIACGIYATNNADICEYILNDCSCQVIVLENQLQLTKILSITDHCPNLKAIVQYTGSVSDEDKKKTTLPIYTWTEFLDLGAGSDDAVVDSRSRSLKPKDLALLIYTSGTTGMPKGVMLSHDNALWTSKMCLASLKFERFRHSLISFLPFSHIAANLIDIISPITIGFTVYFAQPDALRGSLGQTLREVRPTVFFGVPRVFEKIHEHMLELGCKNVGLKKHITNWASEVGYRNCMARQVGKSNDFSYYIANCLVFTKVKKALGLDNCIYVVSGAAPLAQQTLDFFLGFDIMINQVYGMSESSGPHTLGYPDKMKIGTTGSLMKGAEMKVVNPDENGIGEICMKGRHVFMGYHNSEEKTREALDQDGWLHSGDLGKVEDDEFLRITGRIKELIITAGGENIAPVPIEEKIKENLPFVSNAILIGDKKKFISCLLTLKTTVNQETQLPTNKLSPAAVRSLKDIGVEASDVDGLLSCQDPALSARINAAIKEVNDQSVSRAAFVQKWSFLPKDFSIPGGELGPTMKLKRPVITDMYADVINQMYA